VDCSPSLAGPGLPGLRRPDGCVASHGPGPIGAIPPGRLGALTAPVPHAVEPVNERRWLIAGRSAPEGRGGEVARRATGKRLGGSCSTWSFSALGVGSVDAVIAALEPSGGASFEVLDQLPELFVAGFADVESAARVPAGWSIRAVREAGLATRKLGTDAARAMVLTLLVDGQQQRTVEVTHRVGPR